MLETCTTNSSKSKEEKKNPYFASIRLGVYRDKDTTSLTKNQNEFLPLKLRDKTGHFGLKNQAYRFSVSTVSLVSEIIY